MDPVRLYHLEPSFHNEKARKVLEFKSIPYERVRVPYQDHTQVIEETGQDYTPALLTADGETITWEQIADWAEEVAPEPSLHPDDAPRPLCRALDQWALVMVEDATWPVAAPDVAEKVPEADGERWRFVEFQERKYGDLDELRERRPHLRPAVEAQLDLALDLLGETGFLLGEDPSLVDFSLYGGTHPLVFSGVGFPDGYEALERWRKRVDGL